MAGAAIIVSLQQLKSLLGIIHFTKEMGLVPVLDSVFHHRNEVRRFKISHLPGFFSVLSTLQRKNDKEKEKLKTVLALVLPLLYMYIFSLLQWSWQTILMGCFFLAVLLFARHLVCDYSFHSF